MSNNATADVHQLRSRHSLVARVVAPALRIPDTASGVVFASVRERGPVAREAIAASSGLSIATVNRQVSALLEARLLRERPDLAPSGVIGRPRVPVEVDHEPYMALGLHVGARVTTIVASDLLGRTLHAVAAPTPGGSQAVALSSLAESARSYLSRWSRRRPLWIGVAIGGVVDGVSGHVDHARLGWSQAPIGPVLGRALALPVSVSSHVDAMAGAELLLGSHERRATSSGLYVYARETVGFAQVIDGNVYVPAGGPGTIAGLPVQSELLGASGRLESTVSDDAIVAAAHKHGLLPASDSDSTLSALLHLAREGQEPVRSGVRELLIERARVLGGAVALLRDMLNPETVVVGGQAFTEYPESLQQLRAAFVQRSLLSTVDIKVTRFGDRVQEAGASAVSLSNLYADPLGAFRRARRGDQVVNA